MQQQRLILHLLTPAIAGGLIGWWRAPVLEGLFDTPGRLASAPIAGALVMMADVIIIVAIGGLGPTVQGSWEREGAMDMLVTLAASSVIFGVMGLVLGVADSVVGATLGRLAGAGRVRGHQ